MPRNGSGTYTLPQAPFVAGTVISSAAVNSDFSDIASALTGSLPRDGQAGMTGQLKLPDGSTSVPGLSFTNEANTGFSRPTTGTLAVDILGAQVATITSAGWVGPVQGSVPIGTVVDFAGAAAPSQWLLCFGQAISRTTYSALFTLLNTAGLPYGAGDGVTTFNLPDCRGRAVFGKDNMGGSAANWITVAGGNFDGTVLGGSGGLQNQTLTLAQIPTGITSGNASQAISVTTGQKVLNGPNQGSAVGGGTQVTAADAGSGGALSLVTSSGNNVINVTSNSTSGGSHPLMNPAIILNMIIYAGV